MEFSRVIMPLNLARVLRLRNNFVDFRVGRNICSYFFFLTLHLIFPPDEELEVIALEIGSAWENIFRSVLVITRIVIRLHLNPRCALMT